MRCIAKRPQLSRRVHSPEFGSLGDTDGSRLRIMYIVPHGTEPCDFRRRDLAVLVAGHKNPGSLRKELRRTAFVGFEMSGGCTNYTVVRLTCGGERKGIRGCSVEYEEDFAVCVEEFANGVTRTLCKRIIAVSWMVTVARFAEGVPNLGTHTGVVVAAEVRVGRIRVKSPGFVVHSPFLRGLSGFDRSLDLLVASRSVSTTSLPCRSRDASTKSLSSSRIVEL